MLNHPTNHGTVYISGSIKVNRTIIIPSGRQIVGWKNADGIESELVLSNFVPTCDILSCTEELFRIDVPVGERTSGIVIRNLKLKIINPSQP